MLQNPFLDVYQKPFPEIGGWCDERLFSVIDLLGVGIDGNNTRGGVCEIGVHQGKFFMMLNHLTEFNEKSYAIDVFDEQSLNIDKSGGSPVSIFKDNLVKYDRHQGKNTTIIQGDSTDSKLQLVNTIGPGTIRYFSVDGGHTVEHTINDLVIANALIRNDGVVILDDIYNHYWPGVAEGTFKFLQTNPTLVPFCIGYNKLFMCKISYHQYYLDLINKHALDTKYVVKFFNHRVVALPYWKIS